MTGPGEYVPDGTEGITRVEDLPAPHLDHRRRNHRRRRCPRCGRSAGRYGVAQRTLHDLGDPRTGRPRDLAVTYSKHRCPGCRRCFTADLADLALPKCHYTHRVQQTAVRVVVEDGLPYRSASWQLWRDHRVFVPWATIQNWVEAAGEKKRGPCGDRLPRPRPAEL
jgi:ribosomal protein S27AE